MRKLLKFSIAIFLLRMTFCLPAAKAQNVNTAVSQERATAIITAAGKQFSSYFAKGDSVGIYHLYAKDAEYDIHKGENILSAWGMMIRQSAKYDIHDLQFTAISVITDKDYIVEFGRYEMKDNKGVLKASGKYTVVWKQEDGTWKLYRDESLD